MTYWTNSENNHPADSTVHAGLTRAVLQDNIRTVVEQSGYDYDITVRDMPSASSVNNTWEWLAEFDPFPVPVWQAHGGGGWREYTVEILAESTTANDIALRIFLLSQRMHPTLDGTTGDVYVLGGLCTSYKEFTIGAALTRYAKTIPVDFSRSYSTVHTSMDVVWVHLAAYEATPPGGDDLKIHAFNFKESD